MKEIADVVSLDKVMGNSYNLRIRKIKRNS